MTNKRTSDVTSVGSAYETWGLLIGAYNIIGRARALELSRHGLTPEQSHVLHIVADRGGSSTLKEIARIASRQHNAVSTLVRRMEQAGLVERTRKGGTAEYEVRMTEAGRRMVDNVPKASIEMIFESLSADQRACLETCLKILDEKARHLLGLDYLPPF